MVDNDDKFMIGDDVPLSLNDMTREELLDVSMNDPFDIVANNDFTPELCQILKSILNRREQFICIRRYVYNESFKKIGEHLHINGSRVAQLLNRICRKLRYTDELIDLYQVYYHTDSYSVMQNHIARLQHEKKEIQQKEDEYERKENKGEYKERIRKDFVCIRDFIAQSTSIRMYSDQKYIEATYLYIYARFIKRKDTKQIAMQYIPQHMAHYSDNSEYCPMYEFSINNIALYTVRQYTSESTSCNHTGEIIMYISYTGGSNCRYLYISFDDMFRILDIPESDLKYIRSHFVPNEVLRAYILDCMNKKAIEM